MIKLPKLKKRQKQVLLISLTSFILISVSYAYVYLNAYTMSGEAVWEDLGGGRTLEQSLTVKILDVNNVLLDKFYLTQGNDFKETGTYEFQTGTFVFIHIGQSDIQEGDATVVGEINTTIPFLSLTVSIYNYGLPFLPEDPPIYVGFVILSLNIVEGEI